jgi:MOSC domain-containing protein
VLWCATIGRMRITSVHTYPIRSGYRLDHDQIGVVPWGLDGDRRWVIVDAETGRMLTQRYVPDITRLHAGVLPDGSLVVRTDLRSDDLVVPQPIDGDLVQDMPNDAGGEIRRAGAEADAYLSAALNHKVRLVWLANPDHRAGRFGGVAEGYPVLLANLASLDVVNGWLAESGSELAPISMARFRANLVVSEAPAWSEDELIGSRVRIGSAVFDVAKGCGRCVIINVDQDTGELNRDPLVALARHRKIGKSLQFAVNLVPLGTGVVHVGDLVVRDEPGPGQVGSHA